MNHPFRWTFAFAGCLLLLGCGGAATPGDIAAQACDAQVKAQLGSRPYVLDVAALAASMRDDGRGAQTLTAKVTVNAGMADQEIQDLECNARLSDDGSSAEVINLRFIW